MISPLSPTSSHDPSTAPSNKKNFSRIFLARTASLIHVAAAFLVHTAAAGSCRCITVASPVHAVAAAASASPPRFTTALLQTPWSVVGLSWITVASLHAAASGLISAASLHAAASQSPALCCLARRVPAADEASSLEELLLTVCRLETGCYRFQARRTCQWS